MCYLFHKHIYLVFGLINFQCPCCSGCYAAYFCLIFKKFFTFAPLLCFSLSFLCANILDSSSLCVSLLPVCPSLSFPHPRQFTLFPSPAFNICRFASINLFSLLLVIPSPVPSSLPVSMIPNFSSEDIRCENI